MLTQNVKRDIGKDHNKIFYSSKQRFIAILRRTGNNWFQQGSKVTKNWKTRNKSVPIV